MPPFDRAHTTSYLTNRNHASILYCFRDIASYLSEVADFNPPHLHLAPPQGMIPVEFRGDLWCCLCDPKFSRFSRTPAYDGQTTDGHRAMASTADA